MDTFLIETYDLFCPLATVNGQTLSLDLPDDPLYNVQADKERLRQLLTTLIDNAIEYTPKEKNITIHACNLKKSILIEVIDHGAGISDEQKKLIFNRFYRGDKSRTSKKHFGLGLNIAKE
jgi:signal transduction histidine kinase